jgi:hypothetical protein
LLERLNTWFTSIALKTFGQAARRHYRLAKGNSTVVGRDLLVAEHSKTLALQALAQQIGEQFIAEHPTA